MAPTTAYTTKTPEKGPTEATSGSTEPQLDPAVGSTEVQLNPAVESVESQLSGPQEPQTVIETNAPMTSVLAKTPIIIETPREVSTEPGTALIHNINPGHSQTPADCGTSIITKTTGTTLGPEAAKHTFGKTNTSVAAKVTS